MGITTNKTIHDRGRSSLSVTIFWSDSVCFDVLCVVDMQKLFIEVATFLFRNSSWNDHVAIPFRTLITYLTEKLSATSPSRVILRKVDANIVIFTTGRLFDKWFFKSHAAY